MNYYYFYKNGSYATQSTTELEFDELIKVKSDTEYGTQIALVDGEIKPIEQTITIDDEPEPREVDNVALLELLADLFEEIELLKGE